ncbi:hypothetical protein CJD50_22235 [Hafnia paralvei]|uniref:Uncharacterized protein n=1 Tax=Hafnia paralvei TaxID=546367 RepID=A0A2A2M6E7_9GAMM|nr:hypothetical protein [Hafnia paralvei]PAV94158.1 hypothetical protein CJD50_22235 [Hafnia paralvei]
MTSREQFEAWFQDRYAGLLEESYFKLVWVVALESWQASREAVEVVLPPAINTEEIGRAISKERTMTRLALAGIKVIKGEKKNG